MQLYTNVTKYKVLVTPSKAFSSLSSEYICISLQNTVIREAHLIRYERSHTVLDSLFLVLQTLFCNYTTN